MNNSDIQKIALAKSKGWNISPKRWYGENFEIYTYRLVLPNGGILDFSKETDFFNEAEAWAFMPDDPSEWSAFETRMQNDINSHQQKLKYIDDLRAEAEEKWRAEHSRP